MTTQSKEHRHQSEGLILPLDSLLIHLLCPHHDKELERVYQRIPLNEKVVGLVGILSKDSLAANCFGEAATAKAYLAATLLRRAVSQLTSCSSEVTDEALISSLDALLQSVLWLSGRNDATTGATTPMRKMMSHCIAEICLILSIRSNSQCSVVASVIQNIHCGIQSLLLQDNTTATTETLATCVHLLALLPSRAPVAFCHALQQQQQPQNSKLVHSILLSVVSLLAKTTDNIRLWYACMEVLCNVASAFTIVAQPHNAVSSEAQISLQLLMMDSFASTPEKIKVDLPQVNYLAQHVFLPLLEMLLVQIKANTVPDDDACAIVQLWLDTLPKSPQLFTSSQLIQQYVVEIVMVLLMRYQQQRLPMTVLCMEILCSLCQLGTMQEFLQSHYAESVLDLLMQLMVDGVDSDVSAWSEVDYDVDSGEVWDGDEDYLQDVEMIFVNFVSLSRNQFLPNVIQKIQTNSRKNDWKYLRACLSVLELLVDCAPRSFEPYVGETVLFSLTTLSCSNNPRVHYQVCQLLGSIAASGFAMTLEQYSSDVVTALSQLLLSSCRKVVSHSCLALISLLQALSTNGKVKLINLLPDLWKNIQQGVFHSGNQSSNSILHATHLIACLADSMEENFTSPYYKSSMTLLTSCIQSGSSTPEIRGAALESMTIVCKAAAAVASDNSVLLFLSDARNIMSMILPLLEAYAASNNDQNIFIPLEQTLTSSARIASILKEGFAEYAPAVMPFLLQWATQEVDVSVTDADEQDPETESNASSTITVSLPGILGVQRVSLNTTQIQLKSQAARSVYEIASAMGVTFGPYTEPCLTSFIPLVGFKYSMEVRSTTSQALAPIFSSACENAVTGEARARSLPQQVFAPIVKSILQEIATAGTENDSDDIMDDLVAMADALSEILFAAYHHKADNKWCIAVLSPNDADEVTVKVIQLLQNTFMERQGFWSNDDNDEKMHIEACLSMSAQLIASLVDCIGYILKSNGVKFLKTFKDRIAPFLGPKLIRSTGGNDKAAQHAAICLFDDCVEYCGPDAAAEYGKMLVPGIVEVLTTQRNSEDSDELVAAAVYGVSQLARHAPANLLVSVIGIVPSLLEIAAFYQVDSDNALSEGAISALASLLLFPSAPFKTFHTNVDSAKVLDVFLNAMPLRADETEAQACHEGLCGMLEAGDINISSYAQSLLRIIAQTFCAVSDGEVVVSESVLGTYSNILMHMSSNVDSKVLSEAFATLDPEEQQALRDASHQ